MKKFYFAKLNICQMRKIKSQCKRNLEFEMHLKTKKEI